jgi:TRAP-type C4-dicarboxylate transport system substrate-binding protein
VVPKHSAAVAAVLAGEASYDALSSTEQAVVRDEWERRTAKLLEELDLRANFRADGRSWVELDADGNVVRRS